MFKRKVVGGLGLQGTKKKMELDFDMEKVKRFTLAVLSETTEDELS